MTLGKQIDGENILKSPELNKLKKTLKMLVIQVAGTYAQSYQHVTAGMEQI